MATAPIPARVRFAAKQIQFEKTLLVLAKNWINRRAASDDLDECFDREFLWRLDDDMRKLPPGTIQHACQHSQERIIPRPVARWTNTFSMSEEAPGTVRRLTRVGKL